MVNDTLSDMLTRIRNANLVKSNTVVIPFTRINKKIGEILQNEGFIEAFEESNSKELLFLLKYSGPKKKSCIINLKRISKPGLRIYANHKEIPKILGGLGIIIVSTSKGIMTDKKARILNIGGEVLCAIW
jgi:small subunit ribosomal protein S8